MLVSTATLAAHLNDSHWIVFDCRHDLMEVAAGRRMYDDAHIPDAHFAALETDLSGPKTGRNGRHPLPSPDAFAGFLGRHGVTTTSKVVAYDDCGGMYAARFWWLTRWIGLENTSILDGGIAKWRAEGRPVNTEERLRVATHVEPRLNASLVWSADDVARRLGDQNALLIDARAPERYRGDVEPIDPVAGHIPGAMNRFYKLNLNADGTLRPATALREDFAALLQGRSPESVGHQCGSGVTACANVFAMEYAGLGGSKLYAGSWSEWVAERARPVERG